MNKNPNDRPRPEELLRKFDNLDMEKNFIHYGIIPSDRDLSRSEEISKYSEFPWHKYMVHTPEDLQAKSYLNSEFTKLPEIGGRKFNEKGGANDFSKFFGKKHDPQFEAMKKKELYWKAYLRKYHHFSHDYHRVVAHPEVTTSDKDFLEGHAARIPNKLIMSQVCGFVGMLYLYYGTNYGRENLRGNLKKTVTGFSLLPVVVLFGGYQVFHYSINQLTWSSGLAEKYKLHELNKDPNLADLTD